MELSMTSETQWAISDGQYVEYGLMGEDSGISERLSHFLEPIDPQAEGLEGWRVRLPETEDELAEVLSTLV